uniref:Uncharacterized protein n=1 Tax=Arundo donax TaxID=35708 RepID=A0A0A8YU58_ARUDO
MALHLAPTRFFNACALMLCLGPFGRVIISDSLIEFNETILKY